MNKEFCIQCGHKNVFDVARPKFCAGCGSAFNRVNATVSKVTKPIVTKTSTVYEDEDEEQESYNIDINRLKDTFACEMNSRKVSLDDLWSNPAPPEDFVRNSASGPDGEELLKQIQRECSTSRMQDIEGD